MNITYILLALLLLDSAEWLRRSFKREKNV